MLGGKLLSPGVLALSWGCSHIPFSPSLHGPRSKTLKALGQERCRAISALVWFSSTAITPEGHPEPCSLGQTNRSPSQPPRWAGFVPVIWVTEKVTLDPPLSVTAGFLQSSAASVATGFRVFLRDAELERLSPSPCSTHSSQLPLPLSPQVTPHWLRCPPHWGWACQAPRACRESFGFLFSLAGQPGGSSLNTKSCCFLN